MFVVILLGWSLVSLDSLESSSHPWSCSTPYLKVVGYVGLMLNALLQLSFVSANKCSGISLFSLIFSFSQKDLYMSIEKIFLPAFNLRVGCVKV
jgi:hypothetical protein